MAEKNTKSRSSEAFAADAKSSAKITFATDCQYDVMSSRDRRKYRERLQGIESEPYTSMARSLSVTVGGASYAASR
jgi:environmental stress-induced protein Ves